MREYQQISLRPFWKAYRYHYHDSWLLPLSRSAVFMRDDFTWMSLTRCISIKWDEISASEKSCERKLSAVKEAKPGLWQMHQRLKSFSSLIMSHEMAFSCRGKGAIWRYSRRFPHMRGMLAWIIASILSPVNIRKRAHHDDIMINRFRATAICVMSRAALPGNGEMTRRLFNTPTWSPCGDTSRHNQL